MVTLQLYRSSRAEQSRAAPCGPAGRHLNLIKVVPLSPAGWPDVRAGGRADERLRTRMGITCRSSNKQRLLSIGWLIRSLSPRHLLPDDRAMPLGPTEEARSRLARRTCRPSERTNDLASKQSAHRLAQSVFSAHCARNCRAQPATQKVPLVGFPLRSVEIQVSLSQSRLTP